MTTLDLLCLAFLAVVLLLDSLVLWPSFLRRSQADPSRARIWHWSSTMILLWLVVIACAAVWSSEARAWWALGLVAPRGWRLWGAVGLVAMLAARYGWTVIKLARSRRTIRFKLGHPGVERYVPHTRFEEGWWIALSLSAGFCEEFIFRGYFICVFESLLGLGGAAALSVAVFAACHTYQGLKGALGAGVIGSLLTAVVLVSGSLLPAMALHAIVDLGQGTIAWLVLSQAPDEGDPVAA